MKNKPNLFARVLRIFLGLVFFGMGNAYSQKWEIVEKESVFVRSDWNNSNGLPMNSVSKTVQDNMGFIWMATEEGLVRFDGRIFKTFNQKNFSKIQTPSFIDLTNSKIGGIYAVNTTALVYASFNQLDVYNYPPEFSALRFTAITETTTGDVYLGTQNGNLALFSGGNFQKVFTPKLLQVGDIRQLVDFGESILIASQNGLFSFNKTSGEFQSYEFLYKKEVRSILAVPDGNVYIGTKLHGLYLLATNKLSKLEFPEVAGLDKITALESSSADGAIWVGTTSRGILKLKGDQIFTYPDLNQTLNEVNGINEDNQGAIWVTALGNGISRLSISSVEIIDKNAGLSNDVILTTFEDSKSGIWLGTPGKGLNRVTPQGVQKFSTQNGLTHDLILSIAQRGDDIFVGTGNGLNKINLSTLKIEPNYNERIGVKEEVIYSLFKDSKDNIWIGSVNGTLQKLTSEGELITYQLKNQLINAEIVFGMEDSKGVLWFGTYGNGFFSIDAEDKIQHFQIHDIAPGKMAACIWEDPEGDLWIGTTDGLISYSNGALRIFGVKNGLQFETIYKIIPDESGLLWFSGNLGLQNVATKDLLRLKKSEGNNFKIAFTLFDKSDGLPNNEFNGGFHPAGWKLATGKILFPSMGGAVILDPNSIKEEKHLSKPYLASLNYEGQEVFFDGNGIQIPAGIKFFNIRYGIIEFDKPNAINYSYRIKELGDEWIDNENGNMAYFTGLSPGTYEFQVKAQQFGEDSETASMNFTVNAFFYQTIWFKVLGLLGVFAIGFAGITLVMNKKLKTELEQKIKSQTQDLHTKNQSLTLALGRLEKHNRLLKEVAWTQSHQFRGPLSKILGTIQVLRNYHNFKKVGKSKDELLEEIEATSKELDRILRELNIKLEEHDEEK
jgi:ligand-binding sensor domain-containing protein